MSNSAATTLDVLRHVGGAVDEGELRYQLDRRQIAGTDLDDLIEGGYIEVLGSGPQRAYMAVLPQRTCRQGPAERGYSDEAILDRVRLWALITGSSPARSSWDPSKVRRLVNRLYERIYAWQQILELYEAGDWPSEQTVRARFGSLNAALVLAGFEPRSPGTQPLAPITALEPRAEFGPAALARLRGRIERAREAGDADRLREALYDLSAAAYREARAL